MDDSKPFEGKIIFFTAPSGSGKTTIVRRLLETERQFVLFLFQPPPENPVAKEDHGTDYYFLTAKDFLHKVAQTKFAEYEEVYKGLFYGTLKAEIDRIWAMKKHVLVDIDVKGGLRLKKRFPTESLGVFIKLKNLACVGGQTSDTQYRIGRAHSGKDWIERLMNSHSPTNSTKCW